jgi:hypothetical protein
MKGKVDGVITGHSTVMTIADLEEYSAFNNDFRDTVQAAKKAGKSAGDVFAAYKIPDRFKGYAAPAEARLTANIQVVWDETR